MIAEAGLAALCLALSLSLLQLACLLGMGGEAGRRRKTLAAVTGVQAVLLLVGTLLAWNRVLKLEIALAIVVTMAVLAVRSRQRPLVTARMAAKAASIGAALALVGGFTSTALTRTAHISAAPGDQMRFQAWTIEVHDVTPAVGPDWSGFEVELRTSRGNGVVLLKPQRQFQLHPSTERSAAASADAWDGELRASIDGLAVDGKWPIQIEWRPFVSLIGVGAVIASLGGLASLLARPVTVRLRRRRMRLAKAWWA